MENMLHHVLANYEIEGLIGKSLALQIFAAESLMDRSNLNSGKILTGRVVSAIAGENDRCTSWLRRTLMYRKVRPMWNQFSNDLHQGAIPRN